MHATSTLKRAGLWFVRLITDKVDREPDPDTDQGGDLEPWGPDSTKALLDLAEKAIEEGAGLEFVRESDHEMVRLTVLPRE